MSFEKHNLFKKSNTDDKISEPLQDISDSTDIVEFDNWEDLNIEPNLLRGIFSYGYEKPSPIQKKAIPSLIASRDIIAQAQSGTGKTATFTIGGLSQVNTAENATQMIVLAPTHELCNQIANVIKGIGSMLPNLRVQILIGGTSVEDDIQNLKHNVPHIIVGCTGRVYDMIRRNYINTKKIKLVVLDEADEMLSAGFKEQVYNIFNYFTTKIQIALFSATMPDYIFAVAKKFMKNPIQITVKAEQLTLEGIAQYYVAVEDDRQKYMTLKDLYGFLSVSQCIIYANSVKRVADLYDAMVEDGFPVCRIHSGMDKADRDKAFCDFRSGVYRVLISSNVTARGIDIQQVSVVINFDVSKCVHTYLHRIGRGGRWGRKGVGINLITRRDIPKMREIDEFYGTEIKEIPANVII